MLLLQNVRKYYDRREILSIASLTLENDIYVVKGENGSGKSTLLKMIAGLIPFQGEIRIDGVDLKAAPVAYRGAVGWSAAEPLFPDFLTGKEIIAFYNGLRRKNGSGHNELIELLHMTEFIDQKTGTYSSGMLKKLSLILAFTAQPKLLVLDEPFITLDDHAIDQVNRLIIRMHEDQKSFVLMSTHQGTVGLPSFRKLRIHDHQISTES